MNPTIRKFGYPATLIKEFEHWLVLLRPAQPTLGSLVLAARSKATAFSDLPAAAFAELKLAITAIEAALHTAVSYEKINYMMLMMVDREVHYHVIPRYDGKREWNELEFPDAGWPGLPALGQAISLGDEDIAAMAAWVRSFFK
jgi:diadenosine tetraphosphate (Ap4A) HIT family hydrolase